MRYLKVTPEFGISGMRGSGFGPDVLLSFPTLYDECVRQVWLSHSRQSIYKTFSCVIGHIFAIVFRFTSRMRGETARYAWRNDYQPVISFPL
jgi:hypothetical protein